jgi:hypothetical protein
LAPKTQPLQGFWGNVRSVKSHGTPAEMV